MIHLTTGGNGSGKTLNTLKWVRELQVEQGRSVFYANLNIKPEKAAEFGWTAFEVEKWRDLPDGAIILVDECQDFFPPRPNGAKVPEHINEMAKHRHRGFDFFLITQHPRQLDSFIKSQIAGPGWHRHCKRPFGRDMTTVIEWSAVHAQPERESSGKSGSVKLVAHPKDVYDWYKSTTLNTAKKTIPRQVWVIVAALLLVPVCGFFVYRHFDAKIHPQGVGVASGQTGAPGATGGPVVAVAADPLKKYFDDAKPRLAGFPHTAPRYDDVTKPIVAPYPAACIASATSCTCYTQQGTRLLVDSSTCAQIVKDGFFVDWDQKKNQDKADAPAGAQLVRNEAKASAFPPADPPAVAVPGTVQPLNKVERWGRQAANVSASSGAADGEVLAAMRAAPPAGSKIR